MTSALFAIAVTLIGQGYDAPGVTPKRVRVVEDPHPANWLVSSGIIDTGFKGNDAYVDGHFSITAPVYSDIGKSGRLEGSLVFVEPYISWGEQGEIATSLGFGMRHLWNDQPLQVLTAPGRPAGWLEEGVMLGLNGFIDTLSTQTHQQFWQMGAGVELATRYIELRANYYHPLTGRKEVEDHLMHYDGRQERLTSGREPFGRGYTIQQDVTFTTYDLYTETIFRRYEEGLQGWDAEAAILVPWLDQWTELWLVGGYASFDNKPFGPQLHGTGPVKGWKAGVEWRPLPQIVLSATWYEEKQLAGSDWMAGIAFQIPIDPEPSHPNKGFWRKLKDSFAPRSRHLAERAAVPVHRQNAAVKIATSFDQPEVNHIEKVVSSRKARMVVTDNVIFVNNSSRHSSGVAANGTFENGTAEHPFDSIQEGTDMAVSPARQRQRTPTVFVAGGGLPYAETIRIDGANVHYASGGYGIRAFAGKIFGLGTPATITGDSGIPFAQAAVAEVNLAIYAKGGSSASFWIDGFNLDGHIQALNVHDVRVRGNRIRAHDTNAVDIEASDEGFYHVDVSGNRIESELAVEIQFGGLGGSPNAGPIHASVAVSGNTLNFVDSPLIGSGFGVDLVAAKGNVFIDAMVSGNIMLGEAVGVSIPFSLNAFGGDEPGVLRLSSGTTNTLIGFPAADPPFAIFSPLGISGELLINGRHYPFPP